MVGLAVVDDGAAVVGRAVVDVGAAAVGPAVVDDGTVDTGTDVGGKSSSVVVVDAKSPLSLLLELQKPKPQVTPTARPPASSNSKTRMQIRHPPLRSGRLGRMLKESTERLISFPAADFCCVWFFPMGRPSQSRAEFFPVIFRKWDGMVISDKSGGGRLLRSSTLLLLKGRVLSFFTWAVARGVGHCWNTGRRLAASCEVWEKL